MASILSSLRGSLRLGRASLVELIALACNEQVASKLSRILWFSSEREFVEAVEAFAVGHCSGGAIFPCCCESWSSRSIFMERHVPFCWLMRASHMASRGSIEERFIDVEELATDIV